MSLFSNNLLFLLFGWCGIWAGFSAHAQSVKGSSGIVVNADQMSSDFKSKTTSLKGNVQVVFQGQHLSCDRAAIDYKNKRIEARGRVRLQSPNAYAEASRLIVNYEADTAWFEDGFIQSGQVVFEGKEIEKTGTNTYIATEAKYTACASCPPAWSFSGKRIEAELGGYARISRPIMRIGGVPVIILPGIMVPLKSARQSGILVPSLDHTKQGGLAFAESFFWAIDRSHDLTLTGKYYELRGFKGLADYRYVLTEHSRGGFGGAYMKDRAIGRQYKTLGIESETDRWYYNYNHYYELPDNFTQRVSIRQISDLRYLRDFPDEITGHGDPALENRISLTKNLPGQHLSAEASYHVNLLKSYPLAENNDAVHRMPEIHYSLVDRRILELPFLFGLDVTYTNFTRSDFSYDDLSIAGPDNCPGKVARCAQINSQGDIVRDGHFDPNVDLIRTGQRLYFRPTLSMPFQIFDIVEVMPRVSYREAQYRFALDEDTANANFSRSAAQRYLESEIYFRTKLSHVYGDVVSPDARRYKHEIEPEVGFSSIPWVRRPDHGFFGNVSGQRYARIFDPISDTDMFGKGRLQFDYHDRIFDKKLVEFALSNTLTRKRWKNSLPDYERIGTFRLSQSYDLYEARTENPQPWSPVNGLLNVRLDNFETYTTAAYNMYAKVTNVSSRVRLYNPHGEFIQGSYERIYLINEENVVTGPNQTENYGIGLGFSTRFLTLQGQVDYSAVTKELTSWQYVADLMPPGNCWTIRLGHRQVIGGDPEFRFNMAFDFGGDPAKKGGALAQK